MILLDVYPKCIYDLAYMGVDGVSEKKQVLSCHSCRNHYHKQTRMAILRHPVPYQMGPCHAWEINAIQAVDGMTNARIAFLASPSFAFSSSVALILVKSN